MLKKFTSLAAVALIGLMALPSAANATLSLRLTDLGADGAIGGGDDSTTGIILDEGAGDSFPGAGIVTFLGSLATWSVNVTTGTDDTIINGVPGPNIDLNSVNVSSTAGGTMILELTQTGFTSNGFLAGDIGGTAAGMVDAQFFADATNAAFGQGTQLGSTLMFGSGAFSGSTGGNYFGATPYSVTTLVTITHMTGQTTSSFDAQLHIPEPGTLAILGMGLLGMGLTGRRRRKAA